MARVGIVFGLLLCSVTFAGLVGTSAKIPTQFVPMMFGIPILFCGVVALNPHRRKASLQAATGIAMLGAVGGIAWSVFRLAGLVGGQEVDRYALAVIGGMSLICTVFVLVCLRWFSRLRKKNAGLGPDETHQVNLHRPMMDETTSRDVATRESA
ncbi:MAG: hypothetical protein ACR2NZ_07195 [Rubripirellula sp.]